MELFVRYSAVVVFLPEMFSTKQMCYIGCFDTSGPVGCNPVWKFGNTINFLVFSERELTFTFAICCRLSVCLLSVVCLTVVCNARAPYSGGSNFPQYFYGVRYLGHPLTSTENFTEIVPGVAKYSDFGPIDGYVSETAQDRR